jgi:hypothetical protein
MLCAVSMEGRVPPSAACNTYVSSLNPTTAKW